MSRVYLDWNATAPLRPEAREAMSEAFDVIGNPSSVHAEGRAAKMLLERSREEIAEALGASRADIVFTSGSTEAAALALEGQGLACAGADKNRAAGRGPRTSSPLQALPPRPGLPKVTLRPESRKDSRKCEIICCGGWKIMTETLCFRGANPDACRRRCPS